MLAGADFTIRVCCYLQHKTSIHKVESRAEKNSFIKNIFHSARINFTIRGFVLYFTTQANHNVSACAANQLYGCDSSTLWDMQTSQSATVLELGTCKLRSCVLEDGVLSSEGVGTWVTWRIHDPERLRNMYHAAVRRLRDRWPNDGVGGTDSCDGSRTSVLRDEAMRRRVFAARN